MSEKQNLYCNPLPLPDLPPGMDRVYPGRCATSYTNKPCDYREVADPEVLFFEGRYYMYVSCRQAYVSSDLINWEYCPVETDYPLGYAPAIARRGKKFYLTSSRQFDDTYGRIYTAEHPLGPFRTVGPVKDKAGNFIEDFLDPALFVDDDDRIYVYWGYAPLGGGIFGMELDPEQPDRGISDVVKLIEFDSRNSWEHFGEHGEVLDFGWDEGASMYKHNGVYYLQYASCGTRFPNYSIGVYMLDAPLKKPETPAVKMLGRRHGIVCGTGHGGMFTGPGGRPWQAYSVLVHRLHSFERRVGVDPVEFDENGVPFVNASDVPQDLINGDAGLVNVAAWKNSVVSGSMTNCMPMYAFDECPHTAWVPPAEDAGAFIKVNLEREFSIRALRVIWAEQNVNLQAGRNYAPVKYQIRFFDRNDQELPFMIDRSDNKRDLAIEFHSFAPVQAQYVLLSISADNAPLHYGVSDLAVFALPRYIYS